MLNSFRANLHSVPSALARLKANLPLRGQVIASVRDLDPWYQPIAFGLGIHTNGVNKLGSRYRSGSLDRGIGKWRRFVRPCLPFPLTGKRVLEVGCNAGLFLIESVKEGAREAVGIEKDDHYYRQARFVVDTFSRLEDAYYPVRVYQGAMETFDYEGLGRFDLAMFLASIYHIGKSDDYRGASAEHVRDLQVATIKAVARVSRYVLFQGNATADEGRGKGRGSLLGLVSAAGLEVAKETVHDHPRGYLLLAESPIRPETTRVSLDRMISKYFLPPHESPERDLLDRYRSSGLAGLDVTATPFYALRTGQADWHTPGIGSLPAGLDLAPSYWVVPWCIKRRPARNGRIGARVRQFGRVMQGLLELVDTLARNGYSGDAEPIPGYMLVHPSRGRVFQYVDGNRRIGALSHLAARSPGVTTEVPVEVLQTVHRERLLDYPLTVQLIEEGWFTPQDAYRWFDHAFDVVGSEGR